MEELETIKYKLRQFAEERDWDQIDVQEARMSREATDGRSDPLPNKK